MDRIGECALGFVLQGYIHTGSVPIKTPERHWDVNLILFNSHCAVSEIPILFMVFVMPQCPSAKPDDDCTFVPTQPVDVVLSGVVSSVYGLPDCLELTLKQGL